jgi:hypothetical protein
MMCCQQDHPAVSAQFGGVDRETGTWLHMVTTRSCRHFLMQNVLLCTYKVSGNWTLP